MYITSYVPQSMEDRIKVFADLKRRINCLLDSNTYKDKHGKNNLQKESILEGNTNFKGV